MLKSMRKNVKSLSPILWIVIATFIIAIFAVWGGAGRLGEANRTNTIAQIGDKRISADEYYQALRQRIESMKRQYPDLNANLLRQLNFPQQLLEQLIQQNLLLQIAKDMGLRASDNELREKIISFPAFQKDGKFVGFNEYKQILDWNHIPVQKFEDSLREEIILNKITELLTAGITVSEEEVWQNYKKQNETAKIEYAVANLDKIELSYEPSDQERREFFEKNKNKYTVPEKRQGKYVLIKTEDLQKEITVSDSEIEKYYRENINQFKEPAKIKVSRIYLPYTEKDKNQILEQARGLKSRLSAGEDFAYLASTYSKDEKAKNGGDWGYFDWQSLSADEIKEINKLEANQVSEIIDTGSAAVILKATEKMPEITRPLAEVKAMIQVNLKETKARNKANERIEKLAKIAAKTRSLEEAAKREGLKVEETLLLKSGEPIVGIDPSGYISEALFALKKEKEISSPIFTYVGVALAQLTKIVPAHPATYEEVINEVHEDLIKEKKKDLVREKLYALRIAQGKNLEDLAKANNLEYKLVETHKRGQYLSLIDDTAKADQLIFSLPLNQLSDPVDVGSGYAVFKVLDRKEVSREDFEKVKKDEIAQALNQAREMFLYSYLQKVREDKKVKLNTELFNRITEDVLGRIGE